MGKGGRPGSKYGPGETRGLEAHMRHAATTWQHQKASAAAALLAILIAPGLGMAQPAESAPAGTQSAASQPAASPAGPWTLFQLDRFGGLRQAGRPISLRELVQTAGQAPQGAVGVLQYDAGVPDIQVREVLAALRQGGLAEVIAEPVNLERTAMSATVERTEMEEEGLALIQTLADLGRQLPSAIDSAARRIKDRLRDVSERAAAAGEAATGAVRALGGVQAATQPAATR
jgi:hypothetical protein